MFSDGVSRLQPRGGLHFFCVLFLRIVCINKIQIDRTQLPVMDSELYGKYVRRLWRDVLDLERSEEVPKLKVSQSTVDFGKIP